MIKKGMYLMIASTMLFMTVGCGTVKECKAAAKAEAKSDVSAEIQNWMDTVSNAEDFSEVEDYFEEDNTLSEMDFVLAQNMKGLTVTSAESIGQISGKDVITYKYTLSDDAESCGSGIFYMSDDKHYVICTDESIINDAKEKFSCPDCGGSGSVISSNAVVCPICNGTGQQYQANLYYDAVAGWTGGYVGCGGCGGSGYSSGVSVCGSCGGCGIR